LNVFVSEDPDRTWARIGEHLLHDARSYALIRRVFDGQHEGYAPRPSFQGSSLEVVILVA